METKNNKRNALSRTQRINTFKRLLEDQATYPVQFRKSDSSNLVEVALADIEKAYILANACRVGLTPHAHYGLKEIYEDVFWRYLTFSTH